MIPYGRHDVDDEDVAAVATSLRSDWLTTGPEIERFEGAISAAAGGHPTVAVNSGTAALHAAYAGLGLGRGHELVTSPLTFVATAAAAVHLGAEVVFADVEPDTLTLDPGAVAAALTSRTRAVVAVDYAGHPADYDGLAATTRDRSALVADAAHALGSTYKGRPVGDLADATTFSFHPVKTVTTAEGGAVVVKEPNVLERVRRFRSHGITRDPRLLRLPDEGGWHQEVHELAFNYRMPDVLAALGTSQMRRLPQFIARRRELVARYCRDLAGIDGLVLPMERPDVRAAWHLFAVRVLDGRRRELYDRLLQAGIRTQVHYLPVHLQPVFQDLGFRAGMCPVAEAAYTELLSLPLHPSLTDEEQQRVVSVVRDVL